MELELAAILCALVFAGDAEVTHTYEHLEITRRIRVDCETKGEVIEVGLDRRSSNDSLTQALFAARLTGKQPVVVVIDTDGVDDIHEHQLRVTADAVGVPYMEFKRDWLIRLQMTSYLASYGASAKVAIN